jgi:ubiquinone/menaquinone biosynthesis C-methylase UbiE
MVSHAQRTYPHCEFIAGSAERLPLASESADLIVCLDTLHHLRELSCVLREMLRVLKPGGIGYLADLRRDAPIQEIEHKVRRMHPKVAEDFIQSLRSAFTPSEVVTMIGQGSVADVALFTSPPAASPPFADPYLHEADWPLYYRIRFTKCGSM